MFILTIILGTAFSNRVSAQTTVKDLVFSNTTYKITDISAPAVSTTLVISQVYGGGGNANAPYTNDFIELFNRGTTAIDVTGYSVQYASSTGTTWQATNLTGTIQPGRYYLVQEASGGATGSALPTPDATGTLTLAATAGKVALVNSTTLLSGACPSSASIIDFIGYGTTANCSEPMTAFAAANNAPAPSNTTADIRKNGGITDTDNNAADFTAAAPTPRNSAAAAVPSLSINDVTQAEGNAVTTTFNFTVSLSAPAGAGGVTFDIATANGTATTANNDYVAKSLTGQTIPAGSSTYTFSVLVNGDTVIEPNETFLVNVTNVTGATVADGQGQGTITNDDAAANPSVSVSVTPSAGSEAARTAVTVTATASAPVTGNQTVTVSVSGAGITTGDYTLSSNTITIPDGQTTGTAIFTVVDDGISEGTETAILTIGNPSGGITIGSPSSANVTITDNETANTTTVVSPSNMNGFVFFPEGPAGSFSTGTLVQGPPTPPLGIGSARFTLDSQGRETLGTFAFAGTRLDAITKLQYSSYQNNSKNPGAANIAITLQFDVDYNLNDADNSFQGRLVFEPAAQGIPVVQNMFQTFDAINGRFYSSSTSAANPGFAAGCTQANPCTKAQLLALFPNIGIRNTQFGGLLLRAGGPVPGGFDGNADALSITVNGNNTTFDFEPNSQVVTVTTANPNGFAFVQEDPNGVGAFVFGPPTPPIGSGSAQLSVDSNGREFLGTQQFAGTRFDTITQLQYTSYQINPANPQVAITLQFDVDFNLNDADTSFQGRVVYEPSVNGITPQQGMFQTFDATNGAFYLSRTPPGMANNPCTQAAPCTRQQLLALFPNLGVRFVSAGAPNNGVLLLKAGGPVPGGFTGFTDALIVGVNSSNTVFNFEPLAATAAKVDVGGRVLNSRGRGISRAIVKMTDSEGNVRTAYTNSFGYYHFADVAVGQTVIFDIKSKGYHFTEPTQVVSLSEENVGINFTAY